MGGLKGLCLQDTQGGPHKTNFAQKFTLEKRKKGKYFRQLYIPASKQGKENYR